MTCSNDRNLILEASFDDPCEVARIGLVNMWVDERGEDTFKSLMPPNVRVFTTRMAADLEAYNSHGNFVPLGSFDLVARTLPEPNRLDLIAFSCTSGTIASGEDQMDRNFETVHPGVPVTNPATAAIAGLRAAGVVRLALLTPYLLPVHSQLRPYFEGKGFDVAADGTFAILDDTAIGRITFTSIVEAGRRLLRTGAEAVFISCTAMDVVDHLTELSEEIGAPVFSSTQLFAWHALTLLGLERDAEGILRLSFRSN